MLLRIDLDPANVSATRFADDGTLVEDTAITLAQTTCGDNLAHQIAIDPSGDIDTINFAIVGTDADGNVQTETMTGSTTATIESAKYYLTLTSVTPDTTDAATVDIGFVDEFVSQSYKLQYERNSTSKFVLDVTGTIALDVQFTICDVTDRGSFADQEAVLWFEPEASLTNETADSSAIVDVAAGYTYFRVQVNSYTNTAEAQLYVSQPGSC